MNPSHLSATDALAGKPKSGTSVFIPAAGNGRLALELEMPIWDGFRPLDDPRSEWRAAMISLITR